MPEYVYTPGHEVPVEVIADSNGNVASGGDGVAVVGESETGVQVRLVEAVSDRCVGLLKDTPEALRDPTTDESDIGAGQSAGKATLILGEFVVWMNPTDAYAASVGDYVQVAAGGQVEAFTGPTAAQQAADNGLGITSGGQVVHDGTTDAADIDLDFTQDAFPYGYVFTTIAREWGVGNRIAVIKGTL